ncbi:MAG: 50S ribosomal protein L21 [Elusimicrobiota bacterium]
MSKAIVSFGSHQYEVAPGATIEVLRLPYQAGEEFDWDKVNWVAPEGETPAKTGRPTVPGAKVRFQVVAHGRGDKVIVFKKRSKKAWRKRRGHRTDLTKIQVKEIVCG